MMLSAFIVFLSMFALDFVWAFYTKAIQRHAPMASALWAVAILAFNGVAQIGYINDPWLLVPAAVGAFGGTYCAMKFAPKGSV